MVDATRLLAISGLAVGAVAGTVTGLYELPALVIIASAGVPAGLGIAAEGRGHLERRREEQQRRQREADEAAAKEKERVRSIAGAVKQWPLPSIAEVDPFDVGVHRPLLPGGGLGELGAYVARDIDRRAEESLQATGMLLLVGEPGAGVTRAAWELATRQTGNRRLLVPEPGRLAAAVGELDVLSRVTGSYLVLWLDRINDHPDLTKGMLDRCREQSRSLRVIATIPTSQLKGWAAEHTDLAEEHVPENHESTPVSVFRRVQVAQLLSPAERDRAEAAYPGVDVSHGIGAAFTGLRALMLLEESGHTDCPFEPAGADCAIARAVVHVACFWRTTGTPRPLTLPVLANAVTRRLTMPVEEAHLEHALGWATERIVEGISLLTRPAGQDGARTVVAHEGLTDAVTARDKPDTGVWLAALDDAETTGESDTIGRIGYHAHRAGLLDIATNAWDRIHTLDEPGTQWIRKADDLSDRQRRPLHQIPPLTRLLELTETTHGPDHAQVAPALTNLGDAWRELGEARTAWGLYERALTIEEREYGPDHVQVARALTKLGVAWRELGDAGKARELLVRALTIFEREYGPDHVEVARALTNLGDAWRELGDAGKAWELLVRALPILEREYGPDHVRVAANLTNLGIAWQELGDSGRARELHERALTIFEREYGPTHVRVAISLTNLGIAWRVLGDAWKARELHERALTIYEREYGPTHVQVARMLINLGFSWSGEPTRARDLQERALTILEREYGPDHAQVAATLVNLGNAWRELGDAWKARELLVRALTIFEREYGPNHVQVAVTLGSLGLVWRDLGDEGKARTCWERARRIYRQQDPPRPHDVARIERLLSQAAPDVIPLDDGSTAAMPKPTQADHPEPSFADHDPANPDLWEEPTTE